MTRRQTPPLNTLRAFEAAARHVSFMRAAAELHVTPAAVSHRIKELEGILGTALFERRARGVSLTETGRRYHAAIASALADIERATAAVDQASVDGPLNVSVSESFAQLWFSPRLSRLAAMFPGLELTLESDSRLADLHDSRVDVAVRFGVGDYAGLDSEPLLRDAATVLVSSNRLGQHPALSPAALLRDTVLLEDFSTAPNEPWMSWPPWLREAGLRTTEHGTRKLRFSNTGLAILAAVHDAGACIGRVSLVYELLRERRLHALCPWRSTEFSYCLVTRPADRENPRVQAFRSWLVAEAAAYAREVERTLGILVAPPDDP